MIAFTINKHYLFDALLIEMSLLIICIKLNNNEAIDSLAAAW